MVDQESIIFAFKYFFLAFAKIAIISAILASIFTFLLPLSAKFWRNKQKPHLWFVSSLMGVLVYALFALGSILDPHYGVINFFKSELEVEFIFIGCIPILIMGGLFGYFCVAGLPKLIHCLNRKEKLKLWGWLFLSIFFIYVSFIGF